jgi:hypothetical protein
MDPEQLKTTGKRKQYDAKTLLKAIASTTQDDPMSISEWASILGIARTSLAYYVPELRNSGWITTAGEGTAAKQYITEKGLKILKT